MVKVKDLNFTKGKRTSKDSVSVKRRKSSLNLKGFSDVSSLFSKYKNSKVSTEERVFIQTLLEKSSLERELASSAFNKSVLMYLVFLFLAIGGLSFTLISKRFFYILIFMGVSILIIGALSYVITMIAERKKMNVILFNLMLKNPSLMDYDEDRYVILKRNNK